MTTKIFLGEPPAHIKQWIIEHSKPQCDALCFTAQEANSVVGMTKIGLAPDVSLEYSTDGNTWSPFVVGSTTVELANIDDKVYIRATSKGNAGMGCFSRDQGGFIYNRFVMTGKISASGNVDTLLDQNGNATLTFACYYGLFEYCTSLTSAPELPATTLADYCYKLMFRGCTSLTSAPTIKTYTLSLTDCFSQMLNMWDSSNRKWGQLKQCNWPDLTLSEAESIVSTEGIFGPMGDNSVRINITCKDGSATAHHVFDQQGNGSWVFER